MTWRVILRLPWSSALRSRIPLRPSASFRLQRPYTTADAAQILNQTDHGTGLPSNETAPGVADAYHSLIARFNGQGHSIEDSANRALVSLVRSRSLVMAERLRQYMVDSNLPIHFHPVYERAAASVLDGPETDDNYFPRIAAFTHWFSLIPKAHASHPRSFQRIRRSLFHSGEPAGKLAFIMQFALLCASKGYAHLILSQVVTLVTRFADPDVGARFFRQFEENAREYFREFQGEKFSSKDTMKLRGLAVRLCCEAGWLLQAVHLLQGSRKGRSVQIPISTYTLLIERLLSVDDLENVSVVEEQLRIDQLSRLRSNESLRVSGTQGNHTPDDPPAELPALLNVLPGSLTSGMARGMAVLPAETGTSRVAVDDLNKELSRLVEEEQYIDAEHIRTYMHNNSIHIHPNVVYEKASIAWLRAKYDAARDRHPHTYIAEALQWFRHIPQRHETDKPSHLRRQRDLLFRSKAIQTTIQVSFVLRFALACAEKGYADLVWADAITFVQEHVEPAQGAEFFVAFEHIALQYISGREQTEETRWVYGNVEGFAVRACCELGWLSEAAALVERAQKQGVPVPSSATDILRRRLDAQSRIRNLAVSDLLLAQTKITQQGSSIKHAQNLGLQAPAVSPGDGRETKISHRGIEYPISNKALSQSSKRRYRDI